MVKGREVAGFSALPTMPLVGKLVARLLAPKSEVNGLLVIAVGDVEPCFFDGGFLVSQEIVPRPST